MSHPCAFFLAQGRESTAVGRVGFPPFPQKETERMGHGDATAILRPMRIERFGGPGVIGVATVLALFFALARIAANAQAHAANNAVWQMQNSGTTAGLRGIDSVDGTVAWASGTGGTVLRTTDGGAHWTKCAVPDADKDGATLDFRGVQAWDEYIAIVMASGPGNQSRLYKTTDGCETWKLVFKNPDKAGFWDALLITGSKTVLMIGDPLPHTELDRLKVKTFYHFPLYGSMDAGETWLRIESGTLFAMSDAQGKPVQSIFAASNSTLLDMKRHTLIVYATGGSRAELGLLEFMDHPAPLLCKKHCSMWGSSNVPLKSGPTAGAFSLAVRNGDSANPNLVVVGGDYASPGERAGTAAACSRDEKAPLFMTSFKCETSTVPPHGYRSAVQWSQSLKLWITVGTNGSDISRDDGKTWQPLDDGNWNALSLPFVVGPNGRIAKLNPAALPNGKP